MHDYIKGENSFTNYGILIVHGILQCLYSRWGMEINNNIHDGVGS